MMELMLTKMDSFQEKIEANGEEMRTNGEMFEILRGTLVSWMDITKPGQSPLKKK
jgi:hypothetical protein